MSRNALGGSEICDDQLGNYGGSKSEKKRLVKSDSSLSKSKLSAKNLHQYSRQWEIWKLLGVEPIQKCKCYFFDQ